MRRAPDVDVARVHGRGAGLLDRRRQVLSRNFRSVFRSDLHMEAGPFYFTQ